MIGLTKEEMLRMLKRNVPDRPKDEIGQYIHKYLIPSIAEVISANNDAILFNLESDRTSDSGKQY